MRMRLGYLPSHVKKSITQAPPKSINRDTSTHHGLNVLDFIHFKSRSPVKSAQKG